MPPVTGLFSCRFSCVLQGTLIEVQVRCRFDGSRTNDRFHHVSNSLFPGGNQGALRDERFAGRM